MIIILFLCILFKLADGYVVYNRELSTELTKLWDLDTNRCNPPTDYELDLQSYVTNLQWANRDRSHRNLFKSLNEDVIFSKPTYKAFKKLLDNYSPSTNTLEAYSTEEQTEIDEFLSLLIETNIIKEVHRFLKRKNKIRGSLNDFKHKLKDLWFTLYKRTRQDRNVNSCAFEHVFVGERRDRDVLGFHNWIQTYLEEKKGNLNYKGYFRRGTTEDTETQPRLLSFQITWSRNFGKGISTMFVGTSPEFEIGMYTLVHLMDFRTPPSVRVKIYPIEVVTFKHSNNIGTAYPKSLSS